MDQRHGGNLKSIARQYGIPEKEILDFSVSINPQGVPKSALRAIMDEMGRLAHYPDIDALSLREKLAEKDRIPVEHILCGNGSTELLYLIPRVLRPSKALILSPTYSDYERALSGSGSSVSHLLLHKEDDFSLDLDRFIQAMKEGVDLLILCNPNNPTGTLVPLVDIKEILSVSTFTRTTVVIDEAFMDFVLGQSVRFQVTEYENLLVLRSLTQFYGIPGLRAGCLYGPRELIDRIQEHQEPWTVNRLSAAAVTAALDDEEYRQESLRLVQDEREYLSKELGAIPGLCVFPSSANYLLLETSPPMPDPEQLFVALLRTGILVRNCASFSTLGQHFIRVAVKEHDENMLLIEGFKGVARTLE